MARDVPFDPRLLARPRRCDLLTAVAISHGVFTSPGGGGLARTIDVGVSYGTFCVAAVLTYRLRHPWRLPYATALVLAFALLAFVVGRTFTDFGHLLSVLIGFAAYPFTRSRDVEGRSLLPLYRPWRRPVPAGSASTTGDSVFPV
jgi:hypothetical protein